MDYTFPPKPVVKHLELQRSQTAGPTIEPAPPLPHAGGYMDIVAFRKARRLTTSQTSAELDDIQAGPSYPERHSTKEDSSPEKTGTKLPWDKKHGRSQSGIASGLATTLKFGAAIVPAEAITQSQPSEETRPRKSGDK